MGDFAAFVRQEAEQHVPVVFSVLIRVEKSHPDGLCLLCVSGGEKAFCLP